MKIRIVPMERRHLDAVAALEPLCFTEPWPIASFVGELNNPLAVYFVAEQDGAVLGYAGMHAILDEGHVTNIAVAPGHRRLGIGRRLCETLIRGAAMRKLRLLTLEVRESNTAARALYRAYGFTDTGRRRGYYQTPPEDAILMTREAAGGDEYRSL
jgi:ribosomal-protein-alanine N-acetyltransferase